VVVAARSILPRKAATTKAMAIHLLAEVLYNLSPQPLNLSPILLWRKVPDLLLCECRLWQLHLFLLYSLNPSGLRLL
jgi:hypothetical protein